jgi:drug/metabolite transporter (DMT)-like permease
VSGVALALVLASAGMHALWNLLAKRAGGGAAFACAAFLLSAILLVPFAAGELLAGADAGGRWAALLILGSGCLHAAYFALLQRAYRTADLSLAYPIARGTGPLLTAFVAVALLGERPSALAIAGILLVACSILVLAGSPVTLLRERPAGLGAALACGCTIAGYTLWDKESVSSADLPPIAYLCGTMLVAGIVLYPFARLGRMRTVWADTRNALVATAVLSPLAYVLVLFALQHAPVSYVAPARELSVVAGALLGAHQLGEPAGARRLGAAVAIAVGLFCLALG